MTSNKHTKPLNDMTIALSGPDNVQKDKRFHVQTEATEKFILRNSTQQQRHADQSK